MSRVFPAFTAYPPQPLPKLIASEAIVSVEFESSPSDLWPNPNEETADSWPIFEALKKWQSNPELAGLSYNFNHPHSVFALDYTDIFETGRAPYKGSHGVSLFFRHTF